MFARTVQSVVILQSAIRIFQSKCQVLSLCQQRDARNIAATCIAATFRTYSRRQSFLIFRKQVVSLQSTFRSKLAAQKYSAFVASTVKIQANMRRKDIRRQLQQQHHTATRLQASIRCHLRRQEFGRAKRAAVRIQCARRCVVSRSTFKYIRATVMVQKCARRWAAMSSLYNARRACVTMQSHARKRIARKDYVSKAVVSIRVATLYRGQSQRTKYLKGKNAIISLQTTHRQCLAKKSLTFMKQQHAYYIAHRRSMEKSARKIQLAYRFMVEYRTQTAAVLILQSRARSFLKCLRLLRIQKSIGFVQAFWRGCIARSHSSNSLSDMRARVKSANANASDEMKLGNRTSSALQVLLRSKQLSEVFHSIKTLEVSTRLSSVCCSCFAQETNAVPIIYGLMRSCNRSQPHRKLLLHALRVLNNVWPFEMKIARGNAANLAPAFEPRMEILVDLMQVSVTTNRWVECCCFHC